MYHIPTPLIFGKKFLLVRLSVAGLFPNECGAYMGAAFTNIWYAVVVCVRGMWYAWYVVCVVCGMRGIWYAWYLVCVVFGMRGIWYAWYLECVVFGMHGIWYARYVVVVCGMRGMWRAWYVCVVRVRSMCA